MATKENDYDHGNHVGNQGDVVKHTVLIAVLDILLESGNKGGKFTFCDAFSGYGEYALNPEKGECKNGVMELAKKNNSTNAYIENYLGACFAKDKNGEIHYPGSSVIAAMRAARAERELSVKAWDTNEACTKNLREVLEAQWTRIKVNVQKGEMPAGCAKGADLLFIDPPDREGGRATLKKISDLGNDIPPLLIWLPVSCHKDEQDIWVTNTNLQTPKTIKLSRFHVLWTDSRRPRMVVGCEILGYKLAKPAWEAARSAAKEVAKTMNWCICFK